MKNAKGLPEASKALAKTDWAYLAGVIDADGSVGIYRTKSLSKRVENAGNYTYYLRLVITNASTPLMAWLTEYLGGHVDARQRISDRHTQTYNWVRTQFVAGAILKHTRPYMRVKTAEADLAIEYIAQFKDASGRLGMRPEIRELRHGFWQRMANLKGNASAAAETKRRDTPTRG